MSLKRAQLKYVHTDKLIDELTSRFGCFFMIATDTAVPVHGSKPTYVMQGELSSVMSLIKIGGLMAKNEKRFRMQSVIVDSTADGLKNANLPHFKGKAAGLIT